MASVPEDKDVRTDDDFGVMSWHDASLHAIAVEEMEESPGRVLFDLDYVLEWISPSRPGKQFTFRVAPATLVFEPAWDLRGDVTLVGLSFVLSIIAITRSEPDEHGFRHWVVDGNEFRLEFDARGFTQYLRRAPVVGPFQRLSREERGAPSFSERGYLSDRQ